MENTLNKSVSDTEIDRVGIEKMDSHTTPPNFITSRSKRKRDDDVHGDFANLREEMKSMFTTLLAAQKQEFTKNASTLKEIQQSNSNIESSVAFLATQNEEFRKKIDTLENKIKEDRRYIVLLEDKLEGMQQDNRKSNFEIKNAPKKINETKEDLINMVVTLSSTVGSHIGESAIRDVYRVRGRNDATKNAPIIVETTSTLVKNDLLKSCKIFNAKQKDKLRAKHLGMRTSEDTPIFVAEHLTAKAARLHFLARDLVKTRKYKYCWTSYGRVYLRKEDNSPVIVIKSESQIQGLISEK